MRRKYAEVEMYDLRRIKSSVFFPCQLLPDHAPNIHLSLPLINLYLDNQSFVFCGFTLYFFVGIVFRHHTCFASIIRWILQLLNI